MGRRLTVLFAGLVLLSCTGEERGPVAGPVVWSHTFAAYSTEDFAASGSGVWPDGGVVAALGEEIDADGTERWDVQAYDAAGDVTWRFAVSGILGQCVPALAAVPGGDAVVLVQAEGPVDMGGTEVPGAAGPQLVAARVDASGAARWARVLATDQPGGAWNCPAAAGGSDGTIVVLAGAARETAIDLGGGPLTFDDGDPESDGFTALAGYDADGDHLWSGALALAGRQRRAAHAIHPDGRIAVLSSGWSDDATLLALAPAPDVSAAGELEPVWQTSITCVTPDLLLGVDGDEHIHVSGTCGSNGLEGSFDNAYVARFTAGGELEWSADIGDRGFFATELPSGATIAATDEGFLGTDRPFLAAIDADGAIERREKIDVGPLPMGAQYLQIVKSDQAGRLVLAGRFEDHLAFDGVEVPIDGGLTTSFHFLLVREASGR